MLPPKKKRGSSRIQRMAEYELKRRQRQSSRQKEGPKEEEGEIENDNKSMKGKKRRVRGASRQHQPAKDMGSKARRPPSNVKPIKPPRVAKRRPARQKSSIAKRNHQTSLTNDDRSSIASRVSNDNRISSTGNKKNFYGFKDEIKTTMGKFLDLSDKMKKLTAKFNLVKNELECYKETYGDSLRSHNEQSFGGENPFSGKMSFSRIWKRIDKSQKALIIKLRRENYILRKAVEQNEQTYNLIKNLKYNSNGYKDSIEGIIESIAEEKSEENYPVLNSLNKTLSLVHKINTDLEYTGEELDIVRQQQMTQNGNNWSFQQQGFYEVSFNADVNEVIKVLCDFEGRTLEKIQQIDDQIEKNQNQNLAYIRDSLLDELVTINEKYNLLARYKKYDKKFLGKFRKKFSQSEKEKQNLVKSMRDMLQNLSMTLDHNLKELIHNNSRNTVKNEIDTTFLSKFFEGRFKMERVNVDNELCFLLIKIGYFDYITSTKKFKSKFKSVSNRLKQFVKGFEKGVSDPVYEILNLVDNANLGYGQEEAYRRLKDKVIQRLEGFLRDDFRDNDFDTVVSLKALKALGNLAKQYYDSVEELRDDKEQSYEDGED